METVTATISKFIFSNETTGFRVMMTRTQANAPLIITGEFGPEIIPESVATFHGTYTNHAKYGHQFKALSYGIIHNAQELASIKIFLDNIADNVGPERSEAIIAYFGKDTLGVIENTPYRLTEVPGIGSVIAKNISDAWQENRQKWSADRIVYSLRAFLLSLGLRERRIKRVLNHFGGRETSAEQAIKENPYCLIELDDFGFTTVDFIARQLGTMEDSPQRLKAFILYLLEYTCPSNGHLFLNVLEILEYTQKYCTDNNTKFLDKELTDWEIYQLVRELVSEDKVIFEESTRVYGKKQHNFEKKSASLLVQIMEEKSDLIFLNKDKISEFITTFEHEHNWVLSDEQKEALYYFGEKKVFVITGLPGTGKTTILKAIVNLALDMGLSLTCMTPTGISAKKLSGVIQHDAYTIHRRLGFKGNTWTFDEVNQFDTDVAICDESCLPYKQFVDLADGTKKYIGEIVNQKQRVKILSYNIKTEKIESKKIINWFKYPYKNMLYKIYLSKAKNRERQRILRCTGNHKIYTNKGEIKASKINVGDNVLIKGRFLNPFQKSFLLGSILGDANISNRASSGRIIKFVHGQSQRKYLQFKAKLFQCQEKISRGGYKPQKFLYVCSTKVIDDLDFIYDFSYSQNKKAITNEWLNQIDAIGLAAWYMDDGSLSKQKNKNYSYAALFHTEGFNKADCKIISNWFINKWGIKSSLYRNTKGQYYLRLTCLSSKKLWDLITPWTIKSMSYKFPPNYKPNFKLKKESYISVAPYPVQKIERFEPKGNQRKSIYDIEVENNHNYFSNGVLVSNSMVDQEVFFRLLSALKKRTHLIFVGDHNQLPSVGAGNILRELINCGSVPVIKLEKIFRQDEASDIIRASHRIIHGNTNLELFKDDPKADIYFLRIRNPSEIEQVIVALANKFKSEKREFQIISARNDGPLGVNPLNDLLQEALNPSAPHLAEMKVAKFIIRVGDRIIVKKNDYELGIFNGDIGKVVSMGGGKILIKIDDNMIELSADEVLEKIKLAYVISIHKSQGLEYETIILPFINQFGKNMLQRNLLYTAITRAKKKVIVLGHGAAIERSIENTSVTQRNTILGERIKECLDQRKNYSSCVSQLEPPDSPGVSENKEQSLLESEESSHTAIAEKLLQMENGI